MKFLPHDVVRKLVRLPRASSAERIAWGIVSAAKWKPPVTIKASQETRELRSVRSRRSYQATRRRKAARALAARMRLFPS